MALWPFWLMQPAADERPDVHIAVSPPLVTEGSAIQAKVRVTPLQVNRRLRVTVDGRTYYASSERDLSGERERSVHLFWWEGLARGSYLIVVEVEGPDGLLTRRRHELLVIGPSADPES